MLIRLFLAQAVFLVGLGKVMHWESTLVLSRQQFGAVEVLSDCLAVATTAGELLLPVLLVVGLAGRFAAGGLLLLELVAVAGASLAGESALTEHLGQGLLLAVPLVLGPGKLSIDHLLARPCPRSGQGELRGSLGV